MLDNVSINQLRAFVAVCDEGSFTSAARHLDRAQSAVSHAISALETALGVELFERNSRRPELSAAGRSLLSDARAVISRTEEMKTRASSIARVGVPQISLAIDVYFPRKPLMEVLRLLQVEAPTAAINLRMTTMRGGEELLMQDICALAVTISDVPEVSPNAIERHRLCETELVTVCAPSHPLARAVEPIPLDEFGRHVQLVVTDNRTGTEKSQMEVAGKRQWLVNDLGAKHDFLMAGLCWGHMPAHLVAEQIAAGTLVELKRRAWHLHPLTFMVSQRRGYTRSAFEQRLIGHLQDACGEAFTG